jgi:putative membrane protein insertion efficiency factor
MTNSEPTSAVRSSDSVLSRKGPTDLLINLIKGYQWMRRGHVAPCRFYPSCSEYAVEALNIHGVWRGSLLSMKRISKCRPLGPHGIDLVPEAKKGNVTTP